MGEIEKYSTKFPFVFKGVITNSEQLGNFMYRYLGRCTGISHEALLMGGDLTAFSGGVKERVIVFKDPEEDKLYLNKGVEYYNEIFTH